ncbi:hypothetical protein GXW83_04795 [Streptacidiphilus sp. PB12-B1b]|uniref:hypothetical protein n=1 Tax=Streptacidiphilus sp. PB12-B1b TaxID=2705012 RepID=UPI0015FE4292|nr:hypothetical protein [Streptacidiphilus sp. PB12-B1b]QMU74393.1 hypothetical protein GXW83_04795 [Streptacidiphilus sp. PB12-B1b]
MPSDPAFSRAGQPQQQEPVAEEPRTEQTLTTRIRINIPGSRPIPPVVVRSPLGGDRPEGEGGAEAEAPAEQGAVPPPLPKRRHRSDASGSPVLGVMEGSGAATPPDLPPEWQTQGGPTAPAAPGAPGAPAADSEATQETSGTWFVPRKKGRPGQGPQTPQDPAQQSPFEPPFQGQGQGQGQSQGPAQPQAPAQPPVQPQAPAQSPFEPAPQPPFEQPFEPQYQAPQAPYEPTFEQPLPPQPQPQQQPAPPQPPFDQRFEAQFAPQPDAFPFDGTGYRPPADPFAHQPFTPADPERTQQTPLPPQPPQAGAPQSPERTQAFPPFPGFTGGLAAGAAAAAAAASGAPARPAEGDAFEATAALPLFRDDPAAPPAAPGRGAPQEAPRPNGPAKSAAGSPRAPKPPRPAGKKPAAPADGAATGTLRIPVAAPVAAGYAGGTGGAGAAPRKPEPGTAAETAPAKGKRPARGGRARKLAVTGIVVIALAGAVAYGAGLMLNQADVPKGTTVLGYNIGGDTRDNAVNTLNGTVGKLAAEPLRLSVNGKAVSLAPAMAGLTVDTTATEQLAARHSYNPVTVIESLFGGAHPVSPVVVIDQDKLRYALQQLSSGSGSAHEGSVHFDEDGTVVTVLPQSGQGLNVDAAVSAVQQAYRARSDGAPDSVVQLALTAAQPKVSAAAVRNAASTIGAWAMSHRFTVKIGADSEEFGHNTFSKALTLQADASGAMVPVFDLGKLSAVYGPSFAGAQVEHNGVLGPVTPQDIASALTQLLSKPGGPTSITLGSGG